MKVYVVQDTFSGMYAHHSSMTEWIKDETDAAHFTDRARAVQHADRIQKGPRQFAGIGQDTRIVAFELRGRS